ncbi:MAG: hypothetical protein QM757_01670 [Paludibaculum sp.]
MDPDVLAGIDHLIGADTEPLFPVVEYSYGDSVIENGRFRAPCGNRACVDCGQLSHGAGYASIPLSLVLDRCVEVYLNCPWDFNDGRLVPLRIIGQGEMFGVFETLDGILGTPSRKPVWDVAAGIRSVWVVAPLGNSALVGDLLTGRGRGAWDDHKPHWQLIQAVTGDQTKWRLSLLVFPRQLIEKLRSGGADRFVECLLRIGWTQSTGLRHVATEDAHLHEKVREASERLKAPVGELYQFSTIKHWLNIVKGDLPAFQSVHKFSEPGGPFPEFLNTLSAALLRQQRSLRYQYKPILLRPGLLLDDGEAGYYSFRCPSLVGPRMPEVRTYSQLPLDFITLLKRIDAAWARPLKEPHASYFVQPPKKDFENPADRPRPIAGAYTDEMPLGDFFPDARREEIYWSSPFFVSGLRITRCALEETAHLESSVQVGQR